MWFALSRIIFVAAAVCNVHMCLAAAMRPPSQPDNFDEFLHEPSGRCLAQLNRDVGHILGHESKAYENLDWARKRLEQVMEKRTPEPGTIAYLRSQKEQRDALHDVIVTSKHFDDLLAEQLEQTHNQGSVKAILAVQRKTSLHLEPLENREAELKKSIDELEKKHKLKAESKMKQRPEHRPSLLSDDESEKLSKGKDSTRASQVKSHRKKNPKKKRGKAHELDQSRKNDSTEENQNPQSDEKSLEPKEGLDPTISTASKGDDGSNHFAGETNKMSKKEKELAKAAQKKERRRQRQLRAKAKGEDGDYLDPSTRDQSATMEPQKSKNHEAASSQSTVESPERKQLFEQEALEGLGLKQISERNKKEGNKQRLKRPDQARAKGSSGFQSPSLGSKKDEGPAQTTSTAASTQNQATHQRQQSAEGQVKEQVKGHSETASDQDPSLLASTASTQKPLTPEADRSSGTPLTGSSGSRFYVTMDGRHLPPSCADEIRNDQLCVANSKVESLRDTIKEMSARYHNDMTHAEMEKDVLRDMNMRTQRQQLAMRQQLQAVLQLHEPRTSSSWFPPNAFPPPGPWR